MSSEQMPVPQAQLSSDMFGMFGPVMDYAIDAAQRICRVPHVSDKLQAPAASKDR